MKSSVRLREALTESGLEIPEQGFVNIFLNSLDSSRDGLPVGSFNGIRDSLLRILSEGAKEKANAAARAAEKKTPTASTSRNYCDPAYTEGYTPRRLMSPAYIVSGSSRDHALGVQRAPARYDD